MPTTLTRRAAMFGATASAGALTAAAVPALARASDVCALQLDERAVLAGLVENYRRAYQAFEAVFDAQDRGEADDQQVNDALTPVDDALVALCAIRLVDPDVRRARRDFLADKLLPATVGCEGLMQAVYDAFLA